jgi:hypothetical protein
VRQAGKGAGSAIRIIPKGKEKKAKELGERLSAAKPVYTGLPGSDAHGARHTGPSSRNHVLIASADAVICMPGDEGSIAEAKLAAEVYKKPVIAYAPVRCPRKEWHGVIDELEIRSIHDNKDLEEWLIRFIDSIVET